MKHSHPLRIPQVTGSRTNGLSSGEAALVPLGVYVLYHGSRVVHIEATTDVFAKIRTTPHTHDRVEIIWCFCEEEAQAVAEEWRAAAAAAATAPPEPKRKLLATPAKVRPRGVLD